MDAKIGKNQKQPHENPKKQKDLLFLPRKNKQKKWMS